MIVVGLLLALVQKADRTVPDDAAREGRAADIKRLVVAGADTEAKDEYEMTALHWAAGEGHTAIVNDSRGIMDLSHSFSGRFRVGLRREQAKHNLPWPSCHINPAS